MTTASPLWWGVCHVEESSRQPVLLPDGARAQPLPDRPPDKLGEVLAKKAGVRHDNHVVYAISDDGEPTIYVGISDFTVTFGHAVEEGVR